MSHTVPARKGSYGIDAPYVLLVFGIVIVLYAALALALWDWRPLTGAGVMAAVAALWLHAGQRGKFVVWSDLLDGLHLRGDERILDLGCGRGAVVLMAAGHLTTGRAVGVDIWRKADQSGNSLAAAERNAVAEGVSDHVEFRTADVRSLPFEDGGFDLVVSSLALHNIRDRAGRCQALAEAARVLKPGGRLLVVDIWGTARYPSELARLGMTEIWRCGLGWRMWWGGPWVPTFLVSATKPLPPPTQVGKI